MAQKRRKPAGARVEWTKCDCPSPIAHGLYMRCPACGFLFREDPPFNSSVGGNVLGCPRQRVSKGIV